MYLSIACMFISNLYFWIVYSKHWFVLEVQLRNPTLFCFQIQLNSFRCLICNLLFYYQLLLFLFTYLIYGLEMLPTKAMFLCHIPCT